LRDFYDALRHDDPSKANAGALDYIETQQVGSQFTLGGDLFAVGTDGSLDELSLSFEFPFYGQTYSAITIGTDGYIVFGSLTNWSADLEELFRRNRVVAPMLADLNTYDPEDGVFVDTSLADEITVRWNATHSDSGEDVNFSVTLRSNGQIEFHYGAGNQTVDPVVGISRGDDRFSVTSLYSGQTDLANRPSVEFVANVPGFNDIGAIEFQGNSADVEAPLVVASVPTGVHTSGDVWNVTGVSSLLLTVSERLNPISAVATAGYELRYAGASGEFFDGDDTFIPLSPSYDGTTSVELDIPSGPLVPGRYQLTVFSEVDPADAQVVRAVVDTAGNPLDGDGIPATVGGDYVRQFVVVPPSNVEGDLDNDAQVTAADIDVLTSALRQGNIASIFDLNHDGIVSTDDLTFLVRDVLHTEFGDANLDGEIDAEDFDAWQSNRFANNTGWQSGDFNGDGLTDVRDFNLWNRYRFATPSAALAHRPESSVRTPRAAIDQVFADLDDLPLAP
jgi:hypothetical protein